MKRTNLVLDEELLKDARRLSGERAYSSTVIRAPTEMIRKFKVNNFIE